MVSLDHPATSTYVRPLEREQDRVDVLYVTDGDGDELSDATEYHVETVETSSAATATLAEAGAIDCLVCDVDLPEETGLDVLERVRADHETVPFVLLGRASEGTIAADAVNAGADGFFAPEAVGTGQFSERVENVVSEYRSRREQAETTRLLLKLTEYADDALWMFSPDWADTAVINEAYEAIWNRPIENLIADSTDFLEGVHPDDRERVVNAMEVLSEGDPVNIEYRINDDSRGDPWAGVRARPVYDDAGDVEFVAGYTRDITDHKEREASLASLNEAVTELLGQRDRESVAATVVDIVRTVVEGGHAGVRLRGEPGKGLERVAVSDELLTDISLDEESALAPDGDGDWLSGDSERDDSTLVEDAESYFSTGTDMESLLAIPLDEYGLLHVATTDGRPLSEFDRYVLEILGRTTTATLRRVERDRELASHREALERSNENLQQFAYIASHDLQEPLRMVASYVDLLDSEYADQFDDEAREYMDFAVDGARRMQDMVDGLLRYSRVQSEAAAFEAVESQAVFEDTLDALRMRIEETGTTVTCEDLPPVEADANQPGQLFQNLLDNAMSYAGSEEADPTVEVRATVEDELVRFEVSDNGPGVPEAQQERIFEVFSRGQVDGDGTGIGLAVCRRIVRRHGGEIWVESASGEGTTFAFTVPAANPEVRADAR